MASYIALIHASGEGDLGVSFPDLPGCVTAGRDLGEARAMAAEALALHLAGLAEDGEALPAPSALSRIMRDPENREAVAVVVDAPAAAESVVRVELTLTEDELRRVDALAERAGLTRSGILARSARRAVDAA